MKPRIATVVTDLDNTLFDWMGMWGASFGTPLDLLLQQSRVPRDTFLDEIQIIHQRYYTCEYAFFIEELPSLKRLHPEEDLRVVYADVIRAWLPTLSHGGSPVVDYRSLPHEGELLSGNSFKTPAGGRGWFKGGP